MKILSIIIINIFAAWALTSCGTQKQLATVKSEAADTVTVTLHFKNKTFENVHKLHDLKEGSYYYLKVTDLNTSLYKVSLGKTDSTTSVALAIPGFQSFGLDALTKLIAGISPIGGLSTPMPFAKQKQIIDTSQFFLETDEQDFKRKMQESFHALVPKPPSDEDIARTLIEGYRIVLGEQLQELKDAHDEIEDLFFNYNRYQIKAAVEFTGTDPVYQTTNLSLNALYDNLKKSRRVLNDLDDDVTGTFETYGTQIKRFETVIKNNESLKKADEQARAAYQEFTTSLAKIKQSVSSENTLKYINSIISVLNNERRTFRSLPMQHTQEQTTLDINIQPRDEKSLLNSFQTQLTFPKKKYDKFWGVSSGFYISTLHDEAYSARGVYVPESDTTVFSLVKEKPGKAEFGINMMVRRGWTIGELSYFQLGLGPAISVSDKIRPRLMAGMGVALGKKHVVLFDVGGVIGFTDKLSEAYNTSENFSAKPENLSASTLKAGAYFSVSYLFLK